MQPHKFRYWLNPKPDPQRPEQIRKICDVYQKVPELLAQGEYTLSLDEKTGIQALERIAPDLPMISGSPQKIEFEYRRHGTVCMIATMNVADGTIHSSVGKTRGEKDVTKALQLVLAAYPEAKRFHVVLDNLNTHTSESFVRLAANMSSTAEDSLGVKGKSGVLKNVKSRQAFLTDPTHKIVFHYTPKHCSWMNQIEIWFSILARKLLRRSSFSSIDALGQALGEFVDYFNRTMAKPFRWTYQGKPLAV